jgi:hypothetical protein
MAGTILRAGDRVHRRKDRTQLAGVIESCRWWQGEPFYKVRWPHGRRTVHAPQELIHAKTPRHRAGAWCPTPRTHEGHHLAVAEFGCGCHRRPARGRP